MESLLSGLTYFDFVVHCSYVVQELVSHGKSLLTNLALVGLDVQVNRVDMLLQTLFVV